MQIKIEENAQKDITLFFDKEKNKNIKVFCAKNATLNLNFLAIYSIDLKLEFVLENENANINVKGGYVINSDTKVKVKTEQIHKAPNTTSNLDIRGLLFDNSTAYYDGKILIEKDAVFSNATQINKNILLSENSHAISIPSLQVLTDNVKCFHGSASGPLDFEHLNYLMNRGIYKKRAQKILLQAFFSSLDLNDFLTRKINNLLSDIKKLNFL